MSMVLRNNFQLLRDGQQNIFMPLQIVVRVPCLVEKGEGRQGKLGEVCAFGREESEVCWQRRKMPVAIYAPSQSFLPSLPRSSHPSFPPKFGSIGGTKCALMEPNVGGKDGSISGDAFPTADFTTWVDRDSRIIDRFMKEISLR